MATQRQLPHELIYTLIAKSYTRKLNTCRYHGGDGAQHITIIMDERIAWDHLLHGRLSLLFLVETPTHLQIL